MKNFKIGKKTIGKNQPVFVIAEAGVNHNGKLDLAIKLIEVAKKAGADAVKFQTFKAGQLAIPAAKMADYQKKNLGKSQSQLAMLKNLELKEKFYLPIINHCKKRNIIFLSTPHGGFAAVDFLQSLNVPAFKFGSGDLTNLPVLKYAAKFNKPMILGTGMANLSEVKEAIQTIKRVGNNKIIVLHCTTNYPCPINEVNLKAMQTMIKKFDVLVGYSDHTLNPQVLVLATALGACLIEKHFTLSRKLKGPDHHASLEPKELADLIKRIKEVRIIMGAAEKKPNLSEKSIKEVVRKSLVSLTKIKKGEKFTKKNLGIKRPAGGLAPKYYFTLLGENAKKNIKADSLIKRTHYV